jgi:cytochrome c
MRLASVLICFSLGLASSALADGDAAKGQKLFTRCQACHSAAEPANKTGPHLKGIVGRAVASIEGYKYSAGMVEFAKTAGTWDEAKLDAYLADPKGFVPKNKMALGPLKKPEERADLIAYLKTLTH